MNSLPLIPLDQHPPLGPLPPLVGRRGPGKQSSMAVYRQNLHDPADETEGQTGNTRGCLPLELRGNSMLHEDFPLVKFDVKCHRFWVQTFTQTLKANNKQCEYTHTVCCNTTGELYLHTKISDGQTVIQVLEIIKILVSGTP